MNKSDFFEGKNLKVVRQNIIMGVFVNKIPLKKGTDTKAYLHDCRVQTRWLSENILLSLHI